MKSATCPKCFADTSDKQWVYICRRESCKMLDKVVESADAADGKNGQAVCPGCNEPYDVPLCPECGFPVYEDDLMDTSLAISLVGSEGSGKSHFLSVLINELKHNVAKAYACSLFPLGGDATIASYDNQYYQPLYVNGQCIESTEQAELNPLLYSLVFQQERASGAVGLTFYDSCGANFDSIRTMSDNTRNVYHSGGIIFLVDPSQLPVVGEWQAAHGGKVCESDAVALISRVIHLIRIGNAHKSLNKKLDIPIAVCLTKLDTIRQLLDVSSFLSAPARHLREGAFDSVDFNACSLETQSLIEFWGGGEIVRQVTSQFQNYGFFGFSSLGDEPSDSGGIHHISPHRVTDPLLWLLWKNKVLK